MDGSLAEFLQQYIYHGVFLVLLLCGFGLPIPEEVVLILAGYLVYEELAAYWPMAGVCLGGVLLGDILIYALGHHIGNNLIQHRIVSKFISEKNRDRLWAFFQKHGNKTIFLGRFLFGIRTPLFFTAGSIRMSFWRFLRMDFVAALIGVPIIVFLGTYFGSHIQKIVTFIQRWDRSVLILAILALITLVAVLHFRQKRKQKAPLS